MGKFLLGVAFTAVVLLLIGLGVAMLGLFPTPANVEPSHFERRIAGHGQIFHHPENIDIAEIFHVDFHAEGITLCNF